MTETDRLLDILVNGPIHATTTDDRPRASIVAAVCDDIAAGSDVTDACAASSVAPGQFLAWTVDDDDTATAYARALRIRARLLADAPIAAARAIARARVDVLDARMLGAQVGALKAEVELTAMVAEKGEPSKSGKGAGDSSENIVRIVFDPLPVHHQVTPTDAQSLASSVEQRKLSDAVSASYVVVDELDADA